MAFELWDTESRNIVGDYDTESEALAIVRDVIRLDGRAAVESLLLAVEDDRGRTTVIVAGAELVARAQAPAPAVAMGGAAG